MPLLFDHHLQDLKRSGLSDEMIAAMGVTSHDANALQRRLRGASNEAPSDGYEIPYPGTDLVRYRLSTAIQDDPTRKPVRYLSPVGAAWGVYVPPGFETLRGDTLVITEGEKKAAAAVQNGIPAVAIPGVWMWRDPATPRADRVTPATKLLPMLAKLAAGRRVCVLADSDARDNDKVQSAMGLLAKAIAHQVIVEACDLLIAPAAKDGSKQGLDDWILNAGAAAVASAVSSISGIIRPGFRMSVPYAETADEQTLSYLIPFDVAAKPFLPAIYKQVEAEDGSLQNVPTKAPYMWLKHNLLILSRGSDGTYSVHDSDSPAEVMSEVEGITDDRRILTARLRASDLNDKETLTRLGVSGSPAEYLNLARAQRNARKAPTLVVCKDRGWLTVEGEKHYLYGDKAVTPPGAQRVVPDLAGDREGAARAGEHGSFERWADIIAQLIATHPSQACFLGFAASAAGLPFVPDSEPGVLHIYGNSSQGKTTTLQIASSLIGRATSPRDPSSWIRSWRTTENGLEKPLADCNHAPLMLDEIHAAPARMDWQGAAYMISNGRGKQRMSADIEARRSFTWSVQLLSSGEVSLSEKVRRSIRGQMPGGLVFRVIDLYAGNLELVGLGNDAPAWSEVLGYEVSSNRDLAEALECEMAANYGHLWPRLVEWLRDTNGAEYAAIHESYRDKLLDSLPKDASAITQRRTKHAANAMAGLYAIAKLIGLDPHGEDVDVMRGAYDWCKSVMLTAGIEDASSTEAEGMIEELTNELHAQVSRFYRAGQDPRAYGADGSWGWVDDAGSVHLPLKGGWRLLCASCGLDPDRAKDAVESAGWLRKRARHPMAGRNSNPATAIVAPGLMLGFSVDVPDGTPDPCAPL